MEVVIEWRRGVSCVGATGCEQVKEPAVKGRLSIIV